jgi:hypothetical protein
MPAYAERLPARKRAHAPESVTAFKRAKAKRHRSPDREASIARRRGQKSLTNVVPPLANPSLPDDFDIESAAVEAELGAIVAAFIDRWLRKRPCA